MSAGAWEAHISEQRDPGERTWVAVGEGRPCQPRPPLRWLS